MTYSIEHFEGKKEAYNDMVNLIKDMADMGAIDTDVKRMLVVYLEKKVNYCDAHIDVILENMLDEKRSIYE